MSQSPELILLKISLNLSNDSAIKHVDDSVQEVDGRLIQVQATSELILSHVRGHVSQQQDERVLSFEIPPKPFIFHGRDGLVDDIAQKLCTVPSPRYAITGAGGLGKTSLALAVMEHADMHRKYDDRRHWVPCVEATSASRLVDLVAGSLDIAFTTCNPLKDIDAMLRASTQPRLLLLDNFETPWDIIEQRKRIGIILTALFKFPHLAILVTMRSDRPPSIPLPWTTPTLPPLDVLPLNAARQTYQTIDDRRNIDRVALDKLLTAIGCLPLAIILMARLAHTSGLTPDELLEEWRSRFGGLHLLHEASHQDFSVSHSIDLSINSRSMKNTPHALTLLSTLAMLPGGAQITHFHSSLPEIDNFPSALALLINIALAQKDSSSRIISLLPTVRSHVLFHHPLREHHRRNLHATYSRIIPREYRVGDRRYRKTLKAEETNLDFVLRDALRLSPSTQSMDAAVNFGWFQHRLYYRSEMAPYLLEVARREGDDLNVARAGRLLGDMHRMQGRYEEAIAALDDARAHFQIADDALGAAQCIRSLGNIYKMQSRYPEATSALVDAQSRFLTLHDRMGVAQCLQSLGDIYSMQPDHGKASAALSTARTDFLSIGDRLGAAQCLKSLGKILRAQHRYPEAITRLTEALTQFKAIGDRLGAAQCLRSLGNILRVQERYTEAVSALSKACTQFVVIGTPLGAAQCLQSLGQIHAKQGYHKKAIAELREAHGEFLTIGHKREAAVCSEILNELEDRSAKPTNFVLNTSS